MIVSEPSLAERPQGVGHVLPKAVDRREAARVSAFVLALVDSSHVPHSPDARIRRRRACRDVFVDHPLYVIVKLFGELPLDAIAVE
jgi:hypothetical protein